MLFYVALSGSPAAMGTAHLLYLAALVLGSAATNGSAPVNESSGQDFADPGRHVSNPSIL